MITRWIIAIFIALNAFYFSFYLRSKKVGIKHPYKTDKTFIKLKDLDVIEHTHVINLIEQEKLLNLEDVEKDSLGSYIAEKIGASLNCLANTNCESNYLIYEDSLLDPLDKLDVDLRGFYKEDTIRNIFKGYTYLTNTLNVDAINIYPQDSIFSRLEVEVIFDDIINDTIRFKCKSENGTIIIKNVKGIHQLFINLEEKL